MRLLVRIMGLAAASLNLNSSGSRSGPVEAPIDGELCNFFRFNCFFVEFDGEHKIEYPNLTVSLYNLGVLMQDLGFGC